MIIIWKMAQVDLLQFNFVELQYIDMNYIKY